MRKILVTGANGQLGLCFQSLFKTNIEDFFFDFKTSNELDITDQNQVEKVFAKNQYNYLINCAAFTKVDLAENEVKKAFSINVNGVENLAECSKKYGCVLIHISTDFVFDGKQSKPYKENDIPNPIGVYGLTKLNGEKAATIVDEHFIIRTSWLYSEHKHNFLKTMLRLGKERQELSIVYDQIGTPTYAGDLAITILKIITQRSNCYGVYHFSNEGVTSWYDFAKAIFEEANIRIKVNPIKSEEYSTPAKRPNYSVLDKSKIKNKIDIEIPHWKDSLKRCLLNLK